MDIAKLPETLTRPEVETLRNAFGHFYDQEEKTRFVDPVTNLSFDNVEAYVDYLYSPTVGIPKGTSAKHIGITLEKWYETLSTAPEYETTMAGAPEYAVESNTLTPDQLKQFQEEAEATEEKRKAADVTAEINVRAGIERQKEIYDEQIKAAQVVKEKLEKEDKTVYTKVEREPEPALNEEQQAKKEQFIDEVKKDPRAATETIAREIQSREPNVSPEIAGVAAAEVVSSIENAYLAPIQISVVEAARKIPEVSTLASQVSIQEKAKKEVADFVIAGAFGEDFRKEFLPNIKVNVSDTPKPDYQPSSIAYIPTRFIETVKGQKTILENPGITKPEWMRSWVDRQIEMAESGIQGSGSFNEGLVQGYFVSYSHTPRPQEFWQSSGVSQKLDVASGAAEPFNLIGGLAQNIGTGVVKKAATKFVTQKLATQAATQAATTAAGTAAGAEAGVVIGQLTIPIPVVGAIIGAIGGWLASHVDLKKVKEYSAAMVGGLVGLIALPFIGLGAAVGVGAGATAISLGLGGGLGGVTLGGIGAGIGGVIGAIAGAALGAIGIPILFTLLGFPVVVALILFIINSGAYVVPPTPISLSAGASIVSQYIDVAKVANPPGPFQNSELPLTVDYQITIRAKKGTLTNVKIKYDCSVSKKVGSASCPPVDPAIPSAPSSISPAQSFSFSYKQTYESPAFQDSLVSDTITVTADATEQKGSVAAASAAIKIGNPPDACPSGWPVTGNYTITQTPGGRYSHSGIEAMDIGTPMGTPVRATHSGTAHVVHTSGPYRPVYVDVSSNCGGKQFVSRYAHLIPSSVAVSDGQQITMGQVLGASGTNTGPDNAHLHYEFMGLRMDVPYIPKPIVRNCSDNGGKCGHIP